VNINLLCESKRLTKRRQDLTNPSLLLLPDRNRGGRGEMVLEAVLYQPENMSETNMQTSNFARSGSHPRAVAISRTRPPGWTGRAYEPLAPSWRLVQAAKSSAIDEGEYIRRYREEVLSKLDPGKVYADLGEDAVLLCWENSGAFCHRRLVAEWFEEELGGPVKKYTIFSLCYLGLCCCSQDSLFMCYLSCVMPSDFLEVSGPYRFAASYGP
jgi:hypothetical protein